MARSAGRGRFRRRIFAVRIVYLGMNSWVNIRIALYQLKGDAFETNAQLVETSDVT